MTALWRHGPLPPADLIDAVRRRQAWGEATVKTLLHRLMKKGAVRSDRTSGGLRYLPVLGEDDWRAAEVAALADRAFAGDVGALAAFAAALPRQPS